MRRQVIPVFLVIVGLISAGCILPDIWIDLGFAAPAPSLTLIATQGSQIWPIPSQTLTPFLPVENTAQALSMDMASPMETPTTTPSATPTTDYTPLASLTPTRSRTPNKTSTITRTPSPSLSPTISKTPSITPTPTVSYTPSITPTPTVSYTPSQSPLPSLTYTITQTPTPSGTFTPTSTGTITNTPTASFSPSPYLSPTFTVTATVTATSEPSFTASLSATPTATRTPGPTNTPTSTRSGCVPVYNSAYENQIIDLINATRLANGLPALTVHSSLMTSAREHSTDMAVNNSVSHTGSDGSTAWQRMQRAGYVGAWGGENIYAGYSASPTDAYNWWLGSAPHKANILGQYYRYVGVGYAYCSTSSYRNAYTINFGAP